MLNIPSSQPDQRILAFLNRAEKAALLSLVFIAATVIALWLFPTLAALAPSIWSKMTANTAMGMLLAAASLAFSADRRSTRCMQLSRGFALLLGALGLLTLIEYATGFAIGLDLWLPHNEQVTYPGRPSPQSSVAFVLAGACLFLIREDESRRSLLADVLSLLLMLLVLVLLGGYAYGSLQIIGIDRTTLTTPQSLFCLSCIALIAVARRAAIGRLVSVLANVGVGSQVARMVLPGAILLPFISFAIVGYWIESGMLLRHVAHAIMAPLESFLILSVVIWMAWRINVLDRDLHNMTITDELTKVFNRRGFNLLGEQAFREAQRSQSPLTVLFFDLDGLKKVNDTFGHETGSQFVVKVANLLKENFRSADIVARVGGDEFAVVMRANSVISKSVLVLIDAIAESMNVTDDLRYKISYSVGMATFDQTSDQSFAGLVERADAKMYARKQEKKRLTQAPSRIGQFGLITSR